MKIIVIGYGRVGSQFIRKVDTAAHQVVIVDKERSALERGKPPEGVRFLYGNAIDEDLLRDAGAESADILLALTRDENTNLMLAQIARVIFNVPRVVAIVYDPDRESYFHEAGVETLAITAAGAELLSAGLTGAAVKSSVPARALRPVPVTNPRVAQRPLEAHDGSFYVLVVGGGLVGYYLSRSLLKNGHEVTIIERNRATYNLISQQVDCPVVLGEGSSAEVLEHAGAARADILCSVTNHDDDNLISCQVAKYRFGVPKTIARVKNPKNEPLMRRLGVDVTVSATAGVFSAIRNMAPKSPVISVGNLASCSAGIMEFRLTGPTKLAGKKMKAISLPSGCKIIGIVRGGEVLTPNDSTVLQSGDTLVGFVPHTQEEAVRQILLKI
ncbi:MAG TPA: NAD-binding protein [Terriglobia bacterium]|nr:NAD-binding protein [Terriglobia bacterium]